jgi:hypothetical protein
MHQLSTHFFCVQLLSPLPCSPTVSRIHLTCDKTITFLLRHIYAKVFVACDRRYSVSMKPFAWHFFLPRTSPGIYERANTLHKCQATAMKPDRTFTTKFGRKCPDPQMLKLLMKALWLLSFSQACVNGIFLPCYSLTLWLVCFNKCFSILR